MTTMYDAVTASNIPKDADVVAGYVNGRYKWSQADWDRFPNATKVHIQVYIPGRPVSTAGQVLDIEASDANSRAAQAAAVKWVKARKAAGGSPPVIYTSRSTRGPIERALKNAGLSAEWWIADYTGKPHDVPGSVATQWVNRGPYDKSTVKKSWLDQLHGGGGGGHGKHGKHRKHGRRHGHHRANRITLDLGELHDLERTFSAGADDARVSQRRVGGAVSSLDQVLAGSTVDADVGAGTVARIRSVVDPLSDPAGGLSRLDHLLDWEGELVHQLRWMAEMADGGGSRADKARLGQLIGAMASGQKIPVTTRFALSMLLRGQLKVSHRSRSGGGRSGGGKSGGGKSGGGKSGGGKSGGGGSGGGGSGVGARALKVARKEVGTKETSDNYSKRIAQYEATTGAYRQPWCASFVTWSLRHAGKRVSGNGAWVGTYVNLARSHRQGFRVVSAAQARPGDIVAYGTHHIGIMASTIRGGRFRTVEGNYSDSVASVSRTTASEQVYIRYG